MGFELLSALLLLRWCLTGVLGQRAQEERSGRCGPASSLGVDELQVQNDALTPLAVGADQQVVDDTGQLLLQEVAGHGQRVRGGGVSSQCVQGRGSGSSDEHALGGGQLLEAPGEQITDRPCHVSIADLEDGHAVARAAGQLAKEGPQGGGEHGVQVGLPHEVGAGLLQQRLVRLHVAPDDALAEAVLARRDDSVAREHLHQRLLARGQREARRVGGGYGDPLYGMQDAEELGVRVVVPHQQVRQRPHDRHRFGGGRAAVRGNLRAPPDDPVPGVWSRVHPIRLLADLAGSGLGGLRAGAKRGAQRDDGRQ